MNFVLILTLYAVRFCLIVNREIYEHKNGNFGLQSDDPYYNRTGSLGPIEYHWNSILRKGEIALVKWRFSFWAVAMRVWKSGGIGMVAGIDEDDWYERHIDEITWATAGGIVVPIPCVYISMSSFDAILSTVMNYSSGSVMATISLEGDQSPTISLERDQPSNSTLEGDQPSNSALERDQPSSISLVENRPSNSSSEGNQPSNSSSEGDQPSPSFWNFPSRIQFIRYFTTFFLAIFAILTIKYLRQCKRSQQQRERRIRNEDIPELHVKEDFLDTDTDDNKTQIWRQNAHLTKSSCPICLENFEEQTNIMLLPCQHGFHLECIRPWIIDHSDSCPICRRKVIDKLENIEVLQQLQVL